MSKGLVVAVATLTAAALLVAAGLFLGPSSAWFAVVVVWVPMTWLGTVSHIRPLHLPARWHGLRTWESPRVYELTGVRVVKRLLRRGPMAVFNPGLHLPPDRSPERLAGLERKMEEAEATHLVLLVGTMAVVAHAAARGWWLAAAVTLLVNVAVNGYPVMLQRYNRILLRSRYPDLAR